MLIRRTAENALDFGSKLLRRRVGWRFVAISDADEVRSR